MHHVVAVFGGDRDHCHVDATESGRHLVQFLFHLSVSRSVEIDQVELVHGGDEVLDAQQFCDPGVTAGLPQHTCARVDEENRDVSVRRSGEHVAGVTLMARGVGEDVAPRFGREEPVRHIDGDALFALGAQTVRQRGKVRDTLVVGDGVQMIGRQAVGVVQQAADQRALAVVDGTRGGDPQQLTGHQKYPSRLRSSIAAAEVRSSARVSPRSETVAAEISSITRSMSVAVERTAPVMVRSPTVR